MYIPITYDSKKKKLEQQKESRVTYMCTFVIHCV